MSNNLFSLFENMSVIIASLYLLSKLNEYLDSKGRSRTYQFLAPWLFGLLALLVMLHPFRFEDRIIDMRYVLIFFVAYFHGWKHALIVAIFPTIYRLYLGGPTVIEGLILSIGLPLLFGAFVHMRSKRVIRNGFIHKKDLILAFICYEAVRIAISQVINGTPLHLLLLMTIVGIATLSIIALILNDTLKNQRLKSDLLKLSRYDHLTSLSNLRYFKERVNKLLQKGEHIAIAMVDIDHFKQYNDTYGHPTGDVALQSVGQLLNMATRDTDLTARYGGEEFIVCFRNFQHPDQVHQAAEKLRKIIENYYFPGESSTSKRKLTVSIGISYSTHSTKLEKLIDQADQALYKSKETGRNTITFYQP